jgi:hypothetical protein
MSTGGIQMDNDDDTVLGPIFYSDTHLGGEINDIANKPKKIRTGEITQKGCVKHYCIFLD